MIRRKILFVDDEVTFLLMCQEAFERKGYKVKTAENAEKALGILRNEKYLVMFFDIVMPGMNGIDLLREVLKIYPDSFVYAITGYPTEFQREGCLAVGFKDYFVKPVDFELLFKAAEDGFREAEDLGQRADDRGRMTEDGKKIEDEKMTEDG